jgi:hypothetical protein
MVIRKLFISNMKKEEDWINQYIKQGYRLVRKSGLGRYEFTKCEDDTNEYIVRIDFRTFKNMMEFTEYVTLFNDSGWRLLKGSQQSGYLYFEKVSPTADPDIFSDQTSRADMYRRKSNYWLGLFAVYLPTLVVFQTTGVFDLNKIIHPQALYYTPGLWEMSGVKFWKAFLFETPFALGRGFIGYLFLIIILVYAYLGLKALYWYKKEKKTNI